MLGETREPRRCGHDRRVLLGLCTIPPILAEARHHSEDVVVGCRPDVAIPEGADEIGGHPGKGGDPVGHGVGWDLRAPGAPPCRRM